MSCHSQTYGVHWVSVVESLWKYEIDWHALCGYAPLCVVPCLCDRCMVPIPLRPALELNVLGAPGATSMTSCAPLGTQDATNQYKPVDIRMTSDEIHRNSTKQSTKPPNPRPFACRRGVTPQSYLAGSWVHYGRLSHFDPTLHDKFVWSSWVSIFFWALLNVGRCRICTNANGYSDTIIVLDTHAAC